ncbi:MAG: hypothetical protein QRY74_01830 [Chlamydia sp.]
MSIYPSYSFQNFFKSFYASNTYIAPVDLSEKSLSDYLLEKKYPEIAAIAQRLISTPEVQKTLLEPFSRDKSLEIPEKNAILEKNGFTILNAGICNRTDQSIPVYNVIEHPDLSGWIIKAGVRIAAKAHPWIKANNDKGERATYTKEEGLLRIPMANRIAKTAEEAKIEIVIPKKGLVQYLSIDKSTDKTQKYCIVCEKIEILTYDETLQIIKKMDSKKQKEMASKISTIVKKAGIVDVSFHNIRLTPAGKIAFIDTEPVGLMVAKKTNYKKGMSVEKCARIGLFILMNQASDPACKDFRDEVEAEYKNAIAPKLSKWKIVFSILSLGLLPAIYAIVALVKMQLTKNAIKKLETIDKQYSRDILLPMPPEIFKKFIEERKPFIKQVLSYTENVLGTEPEYKG